MKTAEMDEVKLEFEENALQAIAKKALERYLKLREHCGRFWKNTCWISCMRFRKMTASERWSSPKSISNTSVVEDPSEDRKPLLLQ